MLFKFIRGVHRMPLYISQQKKFLTYTKLRDIITMLQISGCSLVVELQPSKLIVWVRFPSSAPHEKVLKNEYLFFLQKFKNKTIRWESKARLENSSVNCF